MTVLLHTGRVTLTYRRELSGCAWELDDVWLYVRVLGVEFSVLRLP